MTPRNPCSEALLLFESTALDAREEGGGKSVPSVIQEAPLLRMQGLIMEAQHGWSPKATAFGRKDVTRQIASVSGFKG